MSPLRLAVPLFRFLPRAGTTAAPAILSRNAVDSLLGVPQARDDLSVKFIGVGSAGVRAVRMLEDDYRRTKLPAAKGCATFLCLDDDGEALEPGRRIGRTALPDVLLLLGELHAGMCGSIAAAIAEHALYHGIATCMVTGAPRADPFASSAPLSRSGARLVVVHPPSEAVEDRLGRAASALTAKLLLPGLVCLDICDLLAVLASAAAGNGIIRAVAGFAPARGPGRALTATRRALQSTGLPTCRLATTTGAWISVRCGSDFRLGELEAAAQAIAASIAPGAIVTAGDYFDPESDGVFELSVVLVVG